MKPNDPRWRTVTEEKLLAAGVIDWCTLPEAKPVIAEMAGDLAKVIEEEVFQKIMRGEA